MAVPRRREETDRRGGIFYHDKGCFTVQVFRYFLADDRSRTLFDSRADVGMPIDRRPTDSNKERAGHNEPGIRLDTGDFHLAVPNDFGSL